MSFNVFRLGFVFKFTISKIAYLIIFWRQNPVSDLKKNRQASAPLWAGILNELLGVVLGGRTKKASKKFQSRAGPSI